MQQGQLASPMMYQKWRRRPTYLVMGGSMGYQYHNGYPKGWVVGGAASAAVLVRVAAAECPGSSGGMSAMT
jgi:hypothetical protein